jgi:SAM-dependent methyltransferase
VGLADALERLADDPIARADMRERSAGLADREFRPAQIAGPLAARLEGRARRLAKPAPPLALNAWHRYAIVDPVIEKLAPTAMLEVGVGRGAMSARLAHHADRYVAVEPDAESRAAAHDALDGRPGARVVEAVDAARVDAPFDVLAAFEVVEHIEDDVAALTDWASLVRPGATVVLSVPAHRRRFGAADVAVGHWRRYDRDDVEHLISSSGLHLDRLFATGWPFGYALEAAWNVAATLRTSGSASRSCEERSAGSGRWHQPGRHVGGCWRWISLPGRLAQRVGRDRGWGTGWVVVAHR